MTIKKEIDMTFTLEEYEHLRKGRFEQKILKKTFYEGII